MTAILALASLLASLILPGYCLTRRLIRSADLLERSIYAVGLGLVVVPTTTFILSWALGLPFTRLFVLSVSLGIVLLCRPWSLPEATRATREQALALGALLVSALLLLQFTHIRAGSSFELFESCLHLMALFLQQYDGSGWTLFDPELGHYVTHVLDHPATPVLGLDLMIEDQRAANGAVMAVMFVLSGRAGIEVATTLFFFVIAGAAALVARTHVDSRAARIAVGAATLAGAHGLMAYMVNETVFCLAAGLLVLALLVRNDPRMPEMAAVGLLLGFGVGSRLAALLWLLPAWLLLRRFSSRARLAAAGGFAISVLPWLLVPWILEGSPLFHSLPDGATVEHTMLGGFFEFRPLNWPFYESLVRAPGHVLPALLLLPVWVFRSAGSIMLAAMLVGFVLLWRKGEKRSLGWVVVAWAAPIAIFLHLLVYTDYEKASWLVLGAPVVPLMLAGFVSGAGRRGIRAPVFCTWALLSCGLAFLPRWLAGVELPEDPRGYSIVSPNFRLEPRFEEDARRDLGRAALFPSLQAIGSRSALLKTLAHPYGGRPFRSGAIMVYMDCPELDEVRFPVNATIEEPSLPEFTSVKPFTIIHTLGERFYIHLRIDSSPWVDVRLIDRQGRFRVMIDPGPLPHVPRYVTFMVDDQWDIGFQGVALTVEVNEQPLPLSRLGYLVYKEESGEPFCDLRLVTNLAAPKPPPESRRVRYGPVEYRYDWTLFEPERTPETEEASWGEGGLGRDGHG